MNSVKIEESIAQLTDGGLKAELRLHQQLIEDFKHCGAYADESVASAVRFNQTILAELVEEFERRGGYVPAGMDNQILAVEEPGEA